MNCPNCGNPVSDGAAFCGSCGSALNAQPYQPVQPTQPVQPVQPVYQAQPQSTDNPYAKSALVVGIVAAALSWLPVVSIILGIVAIKKARYAASMSLQLGKRPMCYIALGLGIGAIVIASIMTVYWIVWIVALAKISSSVSHYYSYSYLR